jgi:thermitase
MFSRSSRLSLLGLALTLSSASAAASDYVPDEILVRFKPGVSSLRDQGAVLGRHRARATHDSRTLSPSSFARVKIEDGSSVEEKIKALAADPDVQSVQPNFIYRALTPPTSSHYSKQWGLKNTGQTIASAPYSSGNPGVPGRDLGAEDAWNLVTDCSPIVVAVIDSGVNYSNADLAGSLWDGGVPYPKHGYNFVDGNDDPMDLNGHGTHVAGIIGGTGANTNGVTGLCWKSNIMALKALNTAGRGTTANIVAAIDFARTNGAKVINMSLGQSQSDGAMNTALTAASNAGIVVIAAAGNNGTNNDATGSSMFPCNSTIANLVCVAALDQTYNLANFSNFGSTSVDVGAPGANVFSTYAGTITTVPDSFHTSGTLNWTTVGSTWAYGQRTLSNEGTTLTLDMLMNPSNWNGNSNRYAANSTGVAYKSFNLASYDSAVLTFGAFIDISTNDYFELSALPQAGDPYSTSGSIPLASYTNDSTGSTSAYLSFDLKDCLTSPCSLGFRLTSDNDATQGFGVGIYGFGIKGLTLTNTATKLENGTSMAAPYVSAIAAMLLTHNPNYTASDAVASIKSGGTPASALSGKTSTGRAASARGSLHWIRPPSGISASVN